MTYILGARCSDGVVLVGDTKVTIEGGADFAYSKKITRPLATVVMGSAGIGGLYKDFQNRMVSTLIQYDKEQEDYPEEERTPLITTEEEFSVIVTRVIRDMHNNYDEDRHLIINNLMIICGSRIGSVEAQLTTFSPYGFPEPVNKIRAIGHGEPFGAVFLKQLWNERMNMEETAKLGLFIIKFLDETGLDNSVGYNKEFLPQVFYIPNIALPEDYNTREWGSEEEYKKAFYDICMQDKFIIRELENKEVQRLINQISPKISDFVDFFKTGEFKI